MHLKLFFGRRLKIINEQAQKIGRKKKVRND